MPEPRCHLEKRKITFVKSVVSTLVCLVVTSCAFAQNQEPKRVQSLTGTVKHHEGFRSEVLPSTRNLIVYLPPDYDKEPKRRYPVLYMHDGQNVFDGMTSFIPNGEWRADEAAEALIRTKLIEPIIIVGIDNGGAARGDEYLPTQMKRGNEAMGGKADLYGRMLIEEIKPMIDRTYRTKRDAANTALAGSSFGGIITLHLGLTHPDVFSKLGVFSPSLWWDNEVMTKLTAALGKKTARKIWLDIGTEEGDQSVPQTERLGKVLEKQGYTLGKDLVVYVDGFAKHNEAAWSSRFGEFLIFMFGTKR